MGGVSLMCRGGHRATIRSMKSAPLLAAALALAAPAAAHAAAPLGPVDYKIVKATHTSTSTKHDEHDNGTSTASWSLSKASKFRMNWMAAGLFSGSGRVNVKGKYDLDATTDWPGHCSWTSPTGDREHPLTAPAPFDLTVVPDARRPGMALVGFVAVQATLNNAYVGTECATRADEPEWKDMQTVDLSPARLRGKTISLKFAGQRTGQDGASYTWKTQIVLKRVP